MSSGYAGNPREVRVVHTNGPVYDFDDFKNFISVEDAKREDSSDRKKSEPVKKKSSSTWDGDKDKLAVSDRIKDLIVNGNDGTYSSRSEPDQAVITAFVHKGVSESDIKAIFKFHPDGIGEKYKDHSSPDEYLNFLCQKELGKHRKRFTKSVMYDFIHFCIADDLVDSDKARNDQVIYLTLQNGLFDLVEETLISHTPEIFTTNLLPYDYEPSAQCPMWEKYLDDVFMGDKDKIIFAQESIGYAFLKEILKPAVFFLVGGGSNGKSVFVNTISNLFGQEAENGAFRNIQLGAGWLQAVTEK